MIFSHIISLIYLQILLLHRFMQVNKGKTCNSIIAGYEEYYNNLVELMQSNTKSSTNNYDCGHNAMVFVAMLYNTLKINMICGEMSILRNSMYNHLCQDLINEGVDESKAKEAAEWAKTSMIDAIKDFTSKVNSELNIFVIDYKAELIKEFIAQKEIIDACKRGKINIYPFPENYLCKDSMPHVSKGDDILVRVETDNVHHAASVLVKPTEKIINSLNKSMHLLREQCSATKLIKFPED